MKTSYDVKLMKKRKNINMSGFRTGVLQLQQSCGNLKTKYWTTEENKILSNFSQPSINLKTLKQGSCNIKMREDALHEEAQDSTCVDWYC